jgi:hypothetical protein
MARFAEIKQVVKEVRLPRMPSTLLRNPILIPASASVQNEPPTVEVAILTSAVTGCVVVQGTDDFPSPSHGDHQCNDEYNPECAFHGSPLRNKRVPKG